MACFRNRLVHLYYEVQSQEVYDILQYNLGDFARSVELMAEELKREPLE